MFGTIWVMMGLSLLLCLMQKQARGLDFCYKNVNHHSLVIRKRPDFSDLFDSQNVKIDSFCQ